MAIAKVLTPVAFVALLSMAAAPPQAACRTQGEPGRLRDTLSLTIKDPAGNVVANFSGSLDAGNIQSTRLGR
jgi:hypothetical protein